jgi:hypothetical protein
MSIFTVKELNWDHQSCGAFLGYFFLNNMLICIYIKLDLFTPIGVIANATMPHALCPLTGLDI